MLNHHHVPSLKGIFSKLKYPEKLIDSTLNRIQHPTDPVQAPSENPVRITLPFSKDKKSADVVRRQLGDLGTKINQQRQPVFTSKRIADHISESHIRKASPDQPAKYSRFVRYKLYWVHLTPPPSTRGGM